MMKCLLVIDYQNDFVSGALGFEEAVALEDGIASLVEQYLAEGNAVIFTRDTHDETYMETREGDFLPIPHCIKGTQGHKLYGKLAKYEAEKLPNVAVIDKTTFGAINLPKEVEALCGSIPDSIELCGVVTNICVLSNAVIMLAAFENTPVAVHANLCAATGDGHETALKAMQGLGVKTL